ncbi:MAG: hypothetical protein II225_02565 [Ruminococcus sp.]|nr:hypothetical protein [Ruminococcus sp.]
MKNFKLLSLILTLLMVLSCMSVFIANADPALEITDPPIVEDPVYSEPDYSEPDYSDPDYTEPEETEPVETDPEYTEPEETEPVETEPEETEEVSIPTEFEEEPATHSDYESPEPLYTPGDQDYEKQEWQSLSLDVSNTNKTGGPGSFAQIKNDRSNRDKTNPVWIILCILFWCLSVAAITCAVLIKPKTPKKPAPAYAGRTGNDSGRTSSGRSSAGRSTQSRSSRTPSPRYEKKYSDDDYNDGF